MRSASPRGPGRDTDRLVPLALLAIALLLSPAVRLWTAPGRPWWLLFALWALLIALIAWVGRGRDHG